MMPADTGKRCDVGKCWFLSPRVVTRRIEAAIIMDEEGAIDLEERTPQPVESGGAHVDSSADPGLYPQRAAAQLFEVS